MSSPPATIGGYTLEAKLGSGGMGAVYRARHPRFPDRTFALKVLLGDAAFSEDDAERFGREMKALSTVTAHPNIVRIFGGAVEGNHPFYVMELVPGAPLSSLAEGRGLEPRRVAALIRTVADAVAYVHEKGVVHRDLKPANILVDAGDVPRICDFGLAKIAEAERLTRSGTMLGTPAYSAPEQLDGRPHAADERSDVYSLGAVLWFALAGRAPLVSDSHVRLLKKVLTEPPDAPSLHAPGVPPELDAICLHALEKTPEDRYVSAAALRDDLDRFLRGEPVAAPALTSLHRLGRLAKRREVTLGIRGALVLTAGVVAALATVHVVQDYWRRDLEHRFAAAMMPGLATRSVADALAFLDAQGAPREQRDALGRRLRECALVDAVAATRSSLTLATAVALGKAAVAAPESASLVGEPIAGAATAGFVVGDALLRAWDAAAGSWGGASDAARVAAVAGDLTSARLSALPRDPAARMLRALVALEAADAPLEPLGGGLVGVGATEGVVADLEAARELPGAPGHRAAWLLVDLLVAKPDDSRARQAIEAATRSHPDEDLEEKLAGVLSATTDARGFGRMRLEGPFVLSRFLARCGLPGALERPELADAVGVDRVLAREELSRARDRFDLRGDLEKPRAVTQDALDEASSLLSRLRNGQNKEFTKESLIDTGHTWEERLRASVEPNRKKIDDHLATALEEQVDQIVLSDCADPTRGSLTCPVFAILAARIDLARVGSLFQAFCEEQRAFSRAFDGVTNTFYADVWESKDKVGRAACEEWEARLAKDMAADPLIGCCRARGLGPDLETAALGARGLRRLEELVEHPPSDAGERDELVFEALRGMEKLASLGGPLVLPYRARLRLIAFEGPLGGALASLDFRRALRFGGHVRCPPGNGAPASLDNLHEFYQVCAAIAADQPERTPGLADELMSAMVVWLHERAIHHVYDPPEGEEEAKDYPAYKEKNDLGAWRAKRLPRFLGEFASDQGMPAYRRTEDRYERLRTAGRLDASPGDQQRGRNDKDGYKFQPHGVAHGSP